MASGILLYAAEVGSAVRIGLDGLVRRRSPGTLGQLGQLGGFGHAALGYGEDDLACSPAVHRGRRPDVMAGGVKRSIRGGLRTRRFAMPILTPRGGCRRPCGSLDWYQHQRSYR